MMIVRRFARPALNLATGRPVLAIFELSLRCNSACRYCALPLNEGRYEMTRDEIATVFGQLYAKGLRFVFVQGGEPLVRRDLIDVLASLRSAGFQLSLITNGTRLTSALAQRLAELRAIVSVSLDTLDRDRYRLIRGADQLRHVLRGLDSLTGYPHPRFITCILSNQNRDDVLRVARFAAAHGFIPVIGAYHAGIGRYGNVDRGLTISPGDAIAVFERVLDSDCVPPGYFSDYLRDNIRWLQGKPLERCDAGRYSVVIDTSGDVTACFAHEPVGNLRDCDIDEILRRFDQRAIPQCSDRSSCNILCSRVVGSALRHPISALQAWSAIRAMARRESISQ